MFCFQRSVKLLDDKFGHVAHHFLVAFDLHVALEALVQDEMVVSRKGVAIDAGVVIAMVGDEFLQLDGRLGQVFYVESHILYQAGGAYGAGSADRREDARPNGPISVVDFGVFRERGRTVEVERLQHVEYRIDILLQRFVRDGFRLGEHGG